MTNWKEKDYVVLEFSTIGDLWFRDAKRRFMQFERESIIEVAAVKIEKGAITKHYTSFVGIEDFDANDYDFGDFNLNAKGITNLHLIGAPKFERVCDELHKFTRDCVLAVGTLSDSPYDDFVIFKESAMNYGYVFNQPVISINDLLFAAELRDRVGDKTFNLEEMTLPEITAFFKRKKAWGELLAERDIYIFDEETLELKGNKLTYALAHAQLLISLINEEEEREEESFQKIEREEYKACRKDCPLDECPFDED